MYALAEAFKLKPSSRRTDMPQQLSKKGALQASNALDRVATLIASEFKTLGIPEKVASDFANRCDLLSDRIERTAGVFRNEDGSVRGAASNGGWDSSNIGREQAGPLQTESDEAYMQGQFSQQENRELREEQESGNLAAPSHGEQKAQVGIQANLHNLHKNLKGAKLSAVAAAKVAKALALTTEILKSAQEEEDEEEDEKESGKKAGHGFNLYL